MNAPSRTALRAAAGETSYARGEDYVRYVAGLHVDAAARRASATIQARNVYQVVLEWGRRDVAGSCTCPYFAQGFFCKHLVAVGLAVAEQGQAQARARVAAAAPAVEEWLAALDADALRDVVRRLASHPDAARDLETLAAAARSDPGELAAVLLAQTKDAMRSRGFVDYRRSFTVAAEAQQVLDVLASVVDDGRAVAAQPALKHAVTRLRAITLHADDSGGTIGDACQRAADLYARACREGGTDGVALARWLVKFRVDSPGWPDITLPAVVDALGDKGLAAYRTGVAAASSKAAGAGTWDRHEIDRMRLELADHDHDVDAAVAVLAAGEHVAYGGIVERLDSARRREEALAWIDRAVAEGRVASATQRSDFWLDPVRVADRYVAAGRPDDAVALLRGELSRRPTVGGYQALLSLAERLDILGAEATWALAMLRERAAREPYERGAVLVELALADGDADGAWAAAEEFGAGPAWRSLVERTASTHPSGCAALLRASIDDDLRYPDTKQYPGIAATLVKVRALCEAAGEADAFAADIADLRERFVRRTSFIAALDRAGL